jgi:hypothetical protein
MTRYLIIGMLISGCWGATSTTREHKLGDGTMATCIHTGEGGIFCFRHITDTCKREQQ